jgi:hypothetical protein
MSEEKSIWKKYQPKGSDTIGIDITELTNKKIDKESEEIKVTGSSISNAGVIADLSPEIYTGENSNYWILKTEHARKLGIKAGMLGTVGITADGKIWTKPIRGVIEDWEDKNMQKVMDNIEKKGDDYIFERPFKDSSKWIVVKKKKASSLQES